MGPEARIEIDALGLITTVITVIIFLNIVLAVVTMFRERRERRRCGAWIWGVLPSSSLPALDVLRSPLTTNNILQKLLLEHRIRRVASNQRPRRREYASETGRRSSTAAWSNC